LKICVEEEGPWTLGSQHGTAAYQQIVEGVVAAARGGYYPLIHHYKGNSNTFVFIFIAYFGTFENSEKVNNEQGR